MAKKSSSVATGATRANAAAIRMTAAHEAAAPGDWLSLALHHHAIIRAAFERAVNAPADGSRLAAMKALALVLTGHSLAEEIVLYPVLAQRASKNADKVYDEQSTAKVEMAALEQIDPADDAWEAKVSEIRASVEHHMTEEEEKWFLEIKASGVNQAKLTARYKEEFDRYTRTGIIATNAAWSGPPRPETA